RGEGTLLAVPERVDRQHLQVNCHRIHRLEPFLERDERLRRALDRGRERRVILPHQLGSLVEEAMRVDVDRLHTLPTDADWPALAGRLRPHRLEPGTTAEGHAGRGSPREELSTGLHGSLRVWLCVSAPRLCRTR